MPNYLARNYRMGNVCSEARFEAVTDSAAQAYAERMLNSANGNGGGHPMSAKKVRIIGIKRLPARVA